MKNNNNTIRIAALTNVGMERDHNEDNFLVGKDLATNDWLLTDEPYHPGTKGALLIVADGMGGTNAGEVASAIAIASIQEYYTKLSLEPPADEAAIQDTMKGSILFANSKLIEHAKKHSETRGMGTTLIMSWLIGNNAYVCWSGDSRAYIFRKELGIKQISKDHSFVQQLVDKGSITEEQAFYHPDSNIITQSLGDSKRLPEPDFIAEPLQSGDLILLCSDGLNGMLQDKDIENILTQNPDIEVCKEVLIAEANKAGGHDNITVILSEIINISSKPIPPGKFKNKAIVPSQKTTPNWRKIGILSAIGLIALIVLWFIIPMKGPFSKESDKKTLADSVPKQSAYQKQQERDIVSKPDKSQREGHGKVNAKNITDSNSEVKSIIAKIQDQLKQIEDKTRTPRNIDLDTPLNKAKDLNINSPPDSINKNLEVLIKYLDDNKAKYKIVQPQICTLQELKTRLINLLQKSDSKLKP